MPTPPHKRAGRPHEVWLEPCPRRVRVTLGGRTVADSTRVRYLFETDHLPVYYFPFEDIDRTLLEPSTLTTRCPYKGEARYWHVVAGEARAENALWAYPEPLPSLPELATLAAFYWDRMEHWYEEDEEVFVHPRDPYSRVDVVASRRRVQVTVGGRVVADSDRTLFLFETGLPTRYYFPPEDVDQAVLVASETTSACPYKGVARYWSAVIDGRTFADIAWAYPDPIPECRRIEGRIAFFNERVDAIRVDGIEQPRPHTQWSR